MKRIIASVALAAGAVATVAAFALLTPGPGSADTGRVSDPRNRGPLDIASVSHGNKGTSVTHTVRMYRPFASKLLTGDNGIAFAFDVNKDSEPEAIVGVLWAHGALRGLLASERSVQSVRVSRPDSRSLKVTIPLHLVTAEPTYGWMAMTMYKSRETCRRTCVDIAPNRRLLQHRLYFTQSLSVHVVGSGSVTSTATANYDGFNCYGECTMKYKRGTTVDLTATPAYNQAFAGWSGACTGTGTCSVKLNGDASVTATFVPTYELTVSAGGGTGHGSVKLSPSDVTCTEAVVCKQRYPEGATVTLTAQPDTSSRFDGWSGACTGTSFICTLTMDGDKTVSATFSGTSP